MDPKKAEDELIEEEPYFKTKVEEKPKPRAAAPSPKAGTEREGRRPLLWGIWVLLIGFALPLLLTHLIESPSLEEHLHIFGVSYHQMLLVFFLSSALMVFTSLLFLRAKPLTLLFFFILSLLSCFPFVVGLRNDLTLRQVILDVPFFSHWPFFVKPAYLLLEYLIPLGILIYLCLQIARMLSKRPHGYAFFGVALYLSVAAFLGISGLSQAQQPTVWTAFLYMRGNPAETETASTSGAPPSLPLPRESGTPSIASQGRSPLPPVRGTPHLRGGDSGNAREPGTAVPPVEQAEVKAVSRELRLLSEKVEGLLVQLGELKALFVARQEKGEEKGPTSVAPEKRGEELTEERRAILDLRKDLRMLSEKADHISGAFSQVGRLLAEPQGTLKKETGAAGPDEPRPEKNKELKEGVEKTQGR